MAGGEPAGPSLGEGRVFNVPEDMAGKTLSLRADIAESKNCGRPKHVLRVGLAEKVPDGWPQRRWEAFGARTTGAIRVLCYNILAPVYARSQLAARDMYPYCPPECLDYGYRQPLLGREILTSMQISFFCKSVRMQLSGSSSILSSVSSFMVELL